MNGIYWGLTSLALMGRKDALDRQEMIDWVMSCWVEEEGGRHPSLLRTLRRKYPDWIADRPQAHLLRIQDTIHICTLL